MRKLKRGECAVLHLGLRHYWYRMIESGEKCVEFREAKPYWQTRIANWSRRMHEGKTPEPTHEEKKAYADAAFMSIGIKKSNTNKQLENKEGGAK